MSTPFTPKKSSLLVALAVGTASSVTLAKSVIVELNDAPVAHQMFNARQAGTPMTAEQIQAQRAELTADQNSFLEALDSNGIAYTMESVDIPDAEGNTFRIDYRYTLVFNGMNLDVTDSALAALETMPQVKKVHDVRELKPMLDKSVAYTRANQVYGQIEELTAFDDHREGYEGQGMYVSVIDTGIDWANEMFGGDPTPPRFGVAPPVASLNNNKVAYYLPISGEGMDTYGHGTHVASTAAGYLAYAPGADGVPNTADDDAVHGMAPQAKVMGYQVCNVAGRCISPATIMALEDSVSPRTLTGHVKPVADVINLSLGGPGGPDDASAVAASNAALAGAIVVAAAGNDGPGEKTLGSPAAGRHVIAVAASNDPGVAPNSVEVFNSTNTDIDASFGPFVAAMSADSNLQQPLNAPLSGFYVYAGLADTPDQVPLSVAGNICLVKRGSTVDVDAADAGTGLFANKAANCQAKGAIATVIFNNTPEPVGEVLAPAASPVFTISGTDGETLQDLGYNAAGISNRMIQLNPVDPSLYQPGIAGFSSRGPILGLGQIKADLAAPGVAVLAATTKSGPPVATMADPTGYTSANGTSMASPHVAGAAALVRQARPELSVAEVRAVLMNTSTNPRFADGTPKADDTMNDSILAQGSGLIDVKAAVNAKAIMGIPGDGVVEPTVLGSYSFKSHPVIDTRIQHSETVDVTLRSLGASGDYTLSVANNRDLQIDGIDVSLSNTSISVGANSSTTFTVSANFDGDKVRSTLLDDGQFLETMWYVIAERNDGSETLRMPFYLKPRMSEPAAVVGTQSETFNGTLTTGDQNTQAIAGVTYQDFPVEVDASAFRLVGDLDYTSNGVDDVDLFLLDPDGNQIASSTNAGGPEHVEANVIKPGTYTYRVSGWLNGPVETTLISTQELGGIAPAVSMSDADFIGSNGESIDFDGDVTVSWAANGGERKFEVERSSDGENFEAIALLDASVTEFTDSDLNNGTYHYRVRSFFDGKVGFYVSAPSNVTSITIDQRSKVNLTRKVSMAISNLDLSNGVFSLDMALTNDSSSDYVPLMTYRIKKIKSASGTVKVINADNGGDGTKGNHAIFDYSYQLGNDDVFSAGETTEARHIRFADPANELFQIYVKVTGYRQLEAGTNTQTSGAAATAEAEEDPSLFDQLVEVTINPVTGNVITQLVDELP